MGSRNLTTYLKAQLQGDAAQTIDGIPLSDQNYLHAVTLLQNCFRQTHKLVSAHMQACQGTGRLLTSVAS